MSTSQRPVTTAISTVAPVGANNALTLPAQRHLVRLTPSGVPRWLLAVQQEWADGRGLGFFRSNDDGRTFAYYKPIQDDPTEKDTADLLAVGDDIALVYSYESWGLSGSSRHDVYFQWWRHSGDDWFPQPAVRVFDSISESDAYYRAELARDSLGRLWVHAFRLTSTGGAIARIAVSTDGGTSFQVQPDLGTYPARAGGRLLSLGSSMVFVWGGHGDVTPTRFRTRVDSAALDQWSAPVVAFPERIYHGAALSAVADGTGGMHLAYKDNNQILYYRRFDGSGFGPAQVIETQGSAELQAAITRVGADLWIFYNRVINTGTWSEVRLRSLSGGVLSEPTVIDGSPSFKGYPADVDVLPAGTSNLSCFVSVTPNSGSPGQLTLYSVALGPSPPPVDAAVSVDAAVRVDAAVPVDAAIPDAGGGPAVLFSDSFGRSGALGPNWKVSHGAFGANGSVALGTAPQSYAFWTGQPSTNVTVAIKLSAPTASTYLGVTSRANPAVPDRDHYAAYVDPWGLVGLARRDDYGYSVLDSRRPPLGGGTHVLSLTTSGTGPVQLSVKVDGVEVIQATDASPQARPAGVVGMFDYEGQSQPLDDFIVTSGG